MPTEPMLGGARRSVELPELQTKIRYLSAAVIICLTAAVIHWAARPPKSADLPPIAHSDLCAKNTFEGVVFIVCAVDPQKSHVGLFRLQPDGTPYRSLARLAQAANRQNAPIAFAMNAGMYHGDLSPVGLYVEAGSEHAPLQTGEGDGNFFLKPNGVFFISEARKAGILTTQDYAVEKPEARFATQSGPMLVVNGALHPKFEHNGTSRFIRNGVGVRDDGMVMFAVSTSEVSFGSFARLFRDALQCPNALYFDGVVSAFSDGQSTLVGGAYPAGPIVAVYAR